MADREKHILGFSASDPGVFFYYNIEDKDELVPISILLPTREARS